MSNIKIYVQTRGVPLSKDYCWINSNNDNEKPEGIPYLNELIQSRYFSLVLSAYKENLLLLITGLEAKGRKDSAGRQIRNSIVWVGEITEENKKYFRETTAEILLEHLNKNEKFLLNALDKSIRFNSENDCGFEFDNEELFRLISASKEGVTSFDKTKHEELVKKHGFRKIAKNTEKNLEELIFDLLCCDESVINKFLTANGHPFIVVTEKKSKDIFIQNKVWRALSDLIENEDWQEFKDKEKFSLWKIILLASGIVIFFLFIIIYLILYLLNNKFI